MIVNVVTMVGNNNKVNMGSASVIDPPDYRVIEWLPLLSFDGLELSFDVFLCADFIKVFLHYFNVDVRGKDSQPYYIISFLIHKLQSLIKAFH